MRVKARRARTSRSRHDKRESVSIAIGDGAPEDSNWVPGSRGREGDRNGQCDVGHEIQLSPGGDRVDCVADDRLDTVTQLGDERAGENVAHAGAQALRRRC